MKKVPKKFAPLLGGVIMSIMMGFLMSGIVTTINVGMPENFIEIWMNAFIRVTPIAFVVILIVRPLVEKILQKITA